MKFLTTSSYAWALVFRSRGWGESAGWAAKLHINSRSVNFLSAPASENSKEEEKKRREKFHHRFLRFPGRSFKALTERISRAEQQCRRRKNVVAIKYSWTVTAEVERVYHYSSKSSSAIVVLESFSQKLDGSFLLPRHTTTSSHTFHNCQESSIVSQKAM